MHDNQSFERDRPCRVAKSELQSSEDLANSSFPSVSALQNVFNVFVFWRCKLDAKPLVSSTSLDRMRTAHLDLGCAFNGFLVR